ncbi:MAG: hypothetical protein D6675_16265 [Gemmatimonadetes bacterium]|nr:MAG: hypothetical protein D6675_16265 [Gemmatimonadota bacterium]
MSAFDFAPSEHKLIEGFRKLDVNQKQFVIDFVHFLVSLPRQTTRLTGQSPANIPDVITEVDLSGLQFKSSVIDQLEELDDNELD